MMSKGIPLIGYWKRESITPEERLHYQVVFERIGLFYFDKNFYFEGEYLWDMKTVREKINYVRVIGKRGALIPLEDWLKGFL